MVDESLVHQSGLIRIVWLVWLRVPTTYGRWAHFNKYIYIKEFASIFVCVKNFSLLVIKCKRKSILRPTHPTILIFRLQPAIYIPVHLSTVYRYILTGYGIYLLTHRSSYSMPGTRYQVPGTGTRYLMPGTWYQPTRGTWYLVPGTRYQVPVTEFVWSDIHTGSGTWYRYLPLRRHSCSMTCVF